MKIREKTKSRLLEFKLSRLDDNKTTSSLKKLLIHRLFKIQLKVYNSSLINRMEEGYVTINQSPSRVISFGGFIDRPLQKRNVVLVIPGKFISKLPQ